MYKLCEILLKIIPYFKINVIQCKTNIANNIINKFV